MNFNKSKVKSWIKRAHKAQSLMYGHGYITDRNVILVEEQHMHPTILEVFGTLTPECMLTIESFQRVMELPDKPIEIVDSKLEYVREPKFRLRIFYNPETGKGFIIDSMYFDFLEEPAMYRFYTNEGMTTMWIVQGTKVVGAVAAFRLREDELAHVSFEVYEGGSQ